MKALFSDVDGTLLFWTKDQEGKEFRPGDLKALGEFKKEGNLVIINSGRPFSGLIPVFENYISWDYLIAASGSSIMDREGKLIYQQPVSYDIVEKLAKEYRPDAEITFVTKNHLYILNQQRVKSIGVWEIDSVEALREKTLYGLSYHFDTIEESEQLKQWALDHGYGSKLEILVNKQDVDIVKKGCSKGVALRWLSEYLQLEKNDIYAIGDAANDIDMLREATHAYTFYDSEEKVKAECEKSVKSVEEMLQLI